MGLAHSCDLCDAALDSLAETWSTDPAVLQEHGIMLYVRDSVMTFSSPALIRDCL